MPVAVVSKILFVAVTGKLEHFLCLVFYNSSYAGFHKTINLWPLPLFVHRSCLIELHLISDKYPGTSQR